MRDPVFSAVFDDSVDFALKIVNLMPMNAAYSNMIRIIRPAL